MRITRVLLVFAAAIVAVGLAGTSATAQIAPQPFVSITDLADGPPGVDLGGLLDPATRLLPEEALVAGLVPVPAGNNGIAQGVRSVELTEPAKDPFGPRVSDFVTLTVGPVTPNPQGGLPFQSVELFFQSDGAPNFDQNVANLPGPFPIPAVGEDGTLQDVSLLLNSGFLTIKVQSDFDSSEVPDGGATASLFVLGALSLAAFGRRAARS